MKSLVLTIFILLTSFFTIAQETIEKPSDNISSIEGYQLVYAIYLLPDSAFQHRGLRDSSTAVIPHLFNTKESCEKSAPTLKNLVKDTGSQGHVRWTCLPILK